MPSEISQIMDTRANMYNLLSRVFRKEVDAEFLDELMHIRYPQHTGNELADISYRFIHRYLCNAREATLDELAVDYARIFLGLGSLDAHAAYPFESVYTSEKGLLMQDARDNVLAVYHANGVVKDKSWKEPEDHLAAELEFMKIMSLRCRDLLDDEKEEEARANVEVQHDFLVNHVLKWTEKFFEDVPLYASTDFYSAFAELTRTYLADDRLLLEELLDSTSNEDEGEDGESASEEKDAEGNQVAEEANRAIEDASKEKLAPAEGADAAEGAKERDTDAQA